MDKQERDELINLIIDELGDNDNEFQIFCNFECLKNNSDHYNIGERIANIMVTKGLAELEEEAIKLTQLGLEIYENGGYLKYIYDLQNKKVGTGINPNNNMDASAILQKRENDCFIILNELCTSVVGKTDHWQHLDKLAANVGIFGEDFKEAYKELRNNGLIRPYGTGYTSYITNEGIKSLAEYNKQKEKIDSGMRTYVPKEKKLEYVNKLLLEISTLTHYDKDTLVQFISKAQLVITKIEGKNSPFFNEIDIFNSTDNKITTIFEWKGNIITVLEKLKIEIDFQNDNQITQSKEEAPIKTNKKGKIFISHSVKDKKLVTDFTEFVLQIGLNINPKEEVFNISIEDAGIKTGEDFRKRIEEELKTAKAVIQIITKNYKNSEACLNEMGAAWILNIPVIPFILEPIGYATVGFIHNPNQLLKLNSRTDLKKFISQHKGELFSHSYDDSKLDRQIERFLELFSVENQPI